MTIFTIGHSNYSIKTLSGFLSSFNIQLLVDVRSNPYSRYQPQFNYDVFKKSLNNEDFAYQYLGDKIGGLYSDTNLQFIDGGVDYSKVRCHPKFVDGIDYLIHLSNKYADIVIMCSEKDPYYCHRFSLISYALSKKSMITHHILPEESNTMSNVDLENKLRSDYGGEYTLDELYSHHNWVLFHNK